MEILPLGMDFQPTGKVYENYNSMVWTERYDTAGDFELVSNNVAETIAMFPRESYISLRDSLVPMVVETYKIEKPAREAPKITVYGRSFESVLERRASVTSLPVDTARAAWTIASAKESDAAYKAMRVVLGDISRSIAGVEVLPAVAPFVSPNDAIPQINLVLPADYSTLTPNVYEIEASDLYTTVQNLIRTNHHGIKATRPSVGKTIVDIEIYNGADLTETLAFDARFDQFDSATYLLSQQGSTNVAYVYGSNGAQAVLKTLQDPSGLDRRVLLVDQSSDETLNTSDLRKSRGLVELYQRNSTAMFDGAIAQQVATGYNSKYFLGDILLLVGEYGLSETVRVSEFIRTSDNTGEKAYPALEVVE